MNWDILEGQWKQFAGNLKDTWGKFTDSDITQLSGKRDHLVGLVQERYGVAKNEAEKQVDTWATKMHAEANAAKDDAHDVAAEAKNTGHGVADAVADIANKAAEALVNASKATAAYVAEKTSR